MRIVVDLPEPFGPKRPRDLADRDAQVEPAQGLDAAKLFVRP